MKQSTIRAAFIIVLAIALTTAFCPTLKASALSGISNVSVSLDAPIAGQTPTTGKQIGAGEGYTVVEKAWYSSGTVETPDSSSLMTDADTFIGGNKYIVEIRINTEEGYYLPRTDVVQVNGVYAHFQGYSTSEGYYDYTFEITAHSPVLINYVEPTCTEDGYEGDLVCDICGTTLKTGAVIPAAHKWDTNYTIDKEPTCTEEGSESIHCSVCGVINEVTIQSIGKIEHSYGGYSVETPASCTHEGSEAIFCEVCGAKKPGSEQVIDRVPHRWVTDTIKATKNLNGSIIMSCTVCGSVGSNETIYHPTVFELSNDKYVYNGSAKKPTVTVKDETGKTISPANYSVSYKNNLNAGQATAVVSFKGDYFEGTKELPFTISPVDIKNVTFPTIAAKTYIGKAYSPVFTPLYKGSDLVKGRDYTATYSNNTNAGSAKITVKGAGNYTGTRTLSFTINPIKISSATLKYSSMTWTGNARTQTGTITVKAKVNGSTKTLTNGTDYTVSYSNNKSVGKATVTIKGTGNYNGTITKTFKINPKGTTIKSLTKASKAITVKWNKQASPMSSSRITGYQIQLATNSSFTANKKTVTVKGYSNVSKKISSLKGNTKYYVRMRTYRTISSGTSAGTYYSTWSPAKTVTTKK